MALVINGVPAAQYNEERKAVRAARNLPPAPRRRPKPRPDQIAYLDEPVRLLPRIGAGPVVLGHTHDAGSAALAVIVGIERQ